MLYGITKKNPGKLERVQKTAARIISGKKKYDKISSTMKALNWLPISQRIEFKILLLTFKCINGLAPSYLMDLIEVHTPTRDLRSSTKLLLNEPKYNLKTFGGISFRCVAPRLWNKLPNHLKQQMTFNSFKKS